VTAYAASLVHPETDYLEKDPGGGIRSALIDGAVAMCGAVRIPNFVGRLEREIVRREVRKVERAVAFPDTASRIRGVRVPGGGVTCVPDIFHAPECAGDALLATVPDGKESPIEGDRGVPEDRKGHRNRDPFGTVPEDGWSGGRTRRISRSRPNTNALRRIPSARHSDRIRGDREPVRMDSRPANGTVGKPSGGSRRPTPSCPSGRIGNRSWPDFPHYRTRPAAVT